MPAAIQLLSCFFPYLMLGLIPEKKDYMDLNDISTGNKTIQLDLTDKEGDDSKKQFENQIQNGGTNFAEDDS